MSTDVGRHANLHAWRFDCRFAEKVCRGWPLTARYSFSIRLIIHLPEGGFHGGATFRGAEGPRDWNEAVLFDHGEKTGFLCVRVRVWQDRQRRCTRLEEKGKRNCPAWLMCLGSDQIFNPSAVWRSTESDGFIQGFDDSPTLLAGGCMLTVVSSRKSRRPSRRGTGLILFA